MLPIRSGDDLNKAGLRWVQSRPGLQRRERQNICDDVVAAHLIIVLDVLQRKLAFHLNGIAQVVVEAVYELLRASKQMGIRLKSSASTMDIANTVYSAWQLAKHNACNDITPEARRGNGNGSAVRLAAGHNALQELANTTRMNLARSVAAALVCAATAWTLMKACADDNRTARMSKIRPGHRGQNGCACPQIGNHSLTPPHLAHSPHRVEQHHLLPRVLPGVTFSLQQRHSM